MSCSLMETYEYIVLVINFVICAKKSNAVAWVVNCILKYFSCNVQYMNYCT